MSLKNYYEFRQEFNNYEWDLFRKNIDDIIDDDIVILCKYFIKMGLFNKEIKKSKKYKGMFNLINEDYDNFETHNKAEKFLKDKYLFSPLKIKLKEKYEIKNLFDYYYYLNL
jgi:hypothetical protein